MTKVYCADLSCKHCSDKGICTQKTIALSFHSVMTLYDGRQEYSRCKMYEKSERAKELEAAIKPIFNNKPRFCGDHRGGTDAGNRIYRRRQTRGGDKK